MNCFGIILLLELAGQNSVGSGQIKGYNQNWSYMPSVDDPVLIANIQKLKPGAIRYPGGTLTHSFDWRSGKITSRPQKVAQPLSQFKKLCDAVKCRAVFVLDICNRSLEDQFAMLTEAKRIGFRIEFVELGNELYAKDKGYEKVFPTGADYGRRVAEWTPKIKAAFPGSKVAALLLARAVQPSNKRMSQWNSQIIPLTKNVVDAYTYHIYIGESGGSFAATAKNFRDAVSRDMLGMKEIWITEYGNQKAESDTSYLPQLIQLADFVESFPNVKLALSHQIVGSEKNKLTKDGHGITPEGELFVKRSK